MNEVEQNTVICQWQADQYLALENKWSAIHFGDWVTCSLLMIICHFAIFMQGRAQLGEKRGFIYAWAEFYLQPIVGWNCTWADHYLWAVICRSRGGLLVNENEENFASNDNNLQWTFTILLVVSFISFTFWYLGCHQYCVGFKDSGNIWFWRWEQSEYKPLLDDDPWGSEKPHALIHNYVYE